MPTTRRPVQATDDAVPPAGPQHGVENWGVSVPQSGQMVPADPEEDEEDSLVAQVRAKLAQTTADGARFKLYRFHSITKQREFCDDMAIDALDEIETVIRNTFGAGTYELRLITRSGVAGRWPLRIADLPTGKPAQAPQSEMSQVLAMLAAGQQQIAETLARMASTPQKSAAESMTEMLTMMKLVREATGVGAAAPAQSPLASIKESLELIRELKGTAAEIAGDKSEADPDNPMTLFSQVVGAIKEVSAAQRGASPAPSASPFPALQMPPSIAQASEESEESDEVVMQQMIATLEGMAGGSVDEAAEFVFKHLPDQFVLLLKHESFASTIGAYSSILAQHVPWCEAVRDAAVKRFANDPG